jgi:hypothetical protein
MAVALTWDLSVLHPGAFEADVVGTSVSGGVAVPGGVSHAASYAYGGLVQVAYGRIPVLGKAQHLLWNRLAARLNGGLRDVAVPILTDRIAPAGIVATLDGAHSLQATSVAIAVTAGAALNGGEWLGLDHADAELRVYRIASIVSATPLGGGAVDYVVTVAPPLRDAAASGATVNFVRPACQMKLAPGESMAWRVGADWTSRPSVSFVEAEF